MDFIFVTLRFFKLPIQIAIGLYLALMMLMVTAAGIVYYGGGIDYCDEFKFAVSGEKLPLMQAVQSNVHSF